MTFRNRVLKTNPSTLILASFLIVITAGTFALSLGASIEGGSIPLIDALFTSTSAVCVTGLIVVDTGRFFTLFGQIVILVLIQIGGLGVMTLSVSFFRFFGRSISFKQRMIMQDLFTHTPTEDIYGLVKSILFFTFSAEFLGAFFLTLRWAKDMPLPRAVYAGIFHSVSAFCNAGFSLFSDSFVRYADDIPTNIVICFLIVTGGIGFPVLYELRKVFTGREKRNGRLSIQTKAVLTATAVLIAGGAVLIGFLERESSAAASPAGKFLVPLFQSVTARTAGFNTVDIGALGDAALAFIIFLMFVGASPGSCGGGVKTTTLALLWAFAASRLKRLRRVTMFRKSIPEEIVDRSVALVVIATGLITLVLFMLLQGGLSPAAGTVQERRTFLALLFETVSAFGTVGLSTGVTPYLSLWGKAWIILTMIIGRVGVLSFSYLFVRAGVSNGIVYSEEKIMIG